MSATGVADHFASRQQNLSPPQSDSPTDAPTSNQDASNDAQNPPSRPQKLNSSATRRIRPGTKAADMAFGPPLVPLSQLDSPFQLQEHLKALYQHYTNPVDSATFTPINRKLALRLAAPPEGVDKFLWLYELCRFLIMKVNHLVVAFFAGQPPCSQSTCPDMRASQWQYLCVVHDPPKNCCAIDYCCHTLDWATDALASSKNFPSRLSLGDSSDGLDASIQLLTNIFRRVYRVFAHAWYQHRQLYWEVESHHGLYVFFKTVCEYYSLTSEEDCFIPPEASGQYSVASTRARKPPGQRMTILRKVSRKSNDDSSSSPSLSSSSSTTPAPDRELALPINLAASARRHKHSPSRGTAVGPIEEATEDDDVNKNAVETKISTAAEPAKSSEDTQSSTPIATAPSQAEADKEVTTTTQSNTNPSQTTEKPSVENTEGKPQEPGSARSEPPSEASEKLNEQNSRDLPDSREDSSRETAETAQTAEPTNDSDKLIDIPSDAADGLKTSKETSGSTQATEDNDSNLIGVSPDAADNEKSSGETTNAKALVNDNKSTNASPHILEPNNQEEPNHETEDSLEPAAKSPETKEVTSEDEQAKAKEPSGEAVEIKLDISSPKDAPVDESQTSKEEAASSNPSSQQESSNSIDEAQMKQHDGNKETPPPATTNEAAGVANAKAHNEQKEQTATPSDLQGQAESAPKPEDETKTETKEDDPVKSPSPSLAAAKPSQEPHSLDLSRNEASATSEEAGDHQTTEVNKTDN